MYVAWFEAGRGEALASIGMSLEHMAANGWQVVVTDLQVRFRVAAVGGDEVTVETWLTEVGGATSRWAQRALRGATVLCEAELRAGSTDTKGRPIRTPREVLEALRQLLPTSPD